MDSREEGGIFQQITIKVCLIVRGFNFEWERALHFTDIDDFGASIHEKCGNNFREIVLKMHKH